jgi:4-amino-4-deoxy-L-arabinose transferase-like glycosyltransferase
MTVLSSAAFSLRRLDRWLAPWLPWLIVALAVGLRFWRLNGQSLWADEGNSAALALRSWTDISQAAAADIHPPLYYWLLSLWVKIFGLSESGLRSLSVVVGAATVGLTFDLGRRLFGRVAGLLAAFLLAMAPLPVYYAQEARMYALLTFWATALGASFVIFLQQEMVEVSPGRRDPPLIGTTPGFVFAVTAILGLYTHYLFPIVLVVINLVYIAWLISTWASPFRRLRLVRWLFLHLVIVFGFWAWAGIAIERVRAWPAPTAAQQGVGAILDALRWLAFGPSGPAVPPLWFWPVLAALLLGLLPVAMNPKTRTPPAPPTPASKGRRASPRRAIAAPTRSTPPAPPAVSGAWTAWALPVAWLLAPLVLMLAFGLFKDAYLKFLLIASPAWALLLARGLLLPLAVVRATPAENVASNGPVVLALTWLTIGLVGISVGAALALNAYYTDPAFARDDYRGMVRTINAVAAAQDVILLDAPGQRDVFSYYYQGDLPVLALPAQRPPVAAETTAALAQGLAGKRRVYALFWATDESDPQRLVETWLDQNAYKVQDTWQGNVRFVTYSLPKAQTPLQPLAVSFAPLADLTGLAQSASAVASGDVLEITLRWHAKAATTLRYKVFLQLLDDSNQVWAQRDAEPVGESRPTSSWQVGETITDRHGLLIPPGTPPGRYRLIAGLYDAASGARLRTPQADFVDLGALDVTRPVKLLPRTAFTMNFLANQSFGDVTLLGFNRYPRGFSHAPETPLHAGDFLHLELFWQADQAPTQDWWVTVSLGDLPGGRRVEGQAPLASRAYAAPQWQVGEIVRGQLDLALPPDLPRGAYTLRMAVHAQGTAPGQDITVGRVNITASP